MQTVHTAYGFAQRNGSQAHVPAHGSGDPGAADAGAATAGGPTDTVSSFTRTTSVRAYDVENHLRTVQTTLHSTGASKTNVEITGPATTIGWGPNGHPANIAVNYPGGVTTNETLHWDGDTILFVTDAAGNVTDFKVGLDGDITPRDGAFSGLSVYDRDPAGVIVQTSNSTGSTGFNPLDPSTVSGAGAVGTSGYQAANVPEQYVRGDGFMVAGVQINGVRAFDPNLGAWTTPDAYEGEVHDPVSQQRYMWNRGNAVEYQRSRADTIRPLSLAERNSSCLGLSASRRSQASREIKNWPMHRHHLVAMFKRRINSAVSSVAAFARRTTKAQLARVGARDQTKQYCTYCKRPMKTPHDPKDPRSQETDHRKSVKNDGDNSDDNKVNACRECNNHKAQMNEDEYRARFPNGSLNK